MPLSLPLLLLTLLTSVPVSRGADPARLLLGWSTFDERAMARIDSEQLLGVLRELEQPVDPETREQRDLALCAFVGRLTRLDAGTHSRQLLPATLTALDRRRDSGDASEFDRFLIERVALMGDRVSLEQRLGACRGLAGSRLPKVTPTMALLTREKSPDLRAAACRTLIGRVDVLASDALLTAACTSPARQQALFDSLLERHLDALDGATVLDSAWNTELATRLGQHVLVRTLDPDWHVASPAIRLAAHVEPYRAGAVLTEALELWTDRERAAAEDRRLSRTGLRRMRFECADALTRLTGRELGPDPDRWGQFWNGVRNGASFQAAFDADSSNDTTARFFGLDLRSNAVAFVIDASGSMEVQLANDGGRYGSVSSAATRYEAACTELLRALNDAAAGTEFRVILFSENGRSWRSSAVEATEASLDSARDWLRRRHPDGGTLLSSGLGHLIGKGDPEDLRSLDIDTVVLLCDGETAEGAGWADAWLETYNRDAQLVFHAVQFGGARAATLQRFSEATGGSFVRLAE